MYSQQPFIYECPESIEKQFPEICFQIGSQISQNNDYWIGFANDLSPLNQILILAVTFIKNATTPVGNKGI